MASTMECQTLIERDGMPDADQAPDLSSPRNRPLLSVLCGAILVVAVAGVRSRSASAPRVAAAWLSRGGDDDDARAGSSSSSGAAGSGDASIEGIESSTTSVYCSRVIQKNTQSVSNASAVFLFYQEHFDAVCQTGEKCVIECESCGDAFRSALRPTRSDRDGCFGMHAVDDRWREQGPVGAAVVAKLYKDALGTMDTCVRGRHLSIPPARARLRVPARSRAVVWYVMGQGARADVSRDDDSSALRNGDDFTRRRLTAPPLSNYLSPTRALARRRQLGTTR